MEIKISILLTRISPCATAVAKSRGAGAAMFKQTILAYIRESSLATYIIETY